MICKQLNEIKAIVSIDKAQKIKSMESGMPFLPVMSDVKIKAIRGLSGPYGIFFDAAGEQFVMGKQRGGAREFNSVESAIKTCRTAGIASFSVEMSPFDILRGQFANCGEQEE